VRIDFCKQLLQQRKCHVEAIQGVVLLYEPFELVEGDLLGVVRGIIKTLSDGWVLL
jgi:hypothetical protein